MNEIQITSDEITKVLQPKNEISQSILKYEAKYLAHQDILTNGLYSVNEINDFGEHLLFVRNAAKK